jgi:hypothetical protein
MRIRQAQRSCPDMRLLHTRLLELQSFIGSRPTYAIISHCWEEEEVLFSDVTTFEEARKKRDFTKVEKTCEQAADDGLDYVRIDACCIDKSSSTELSEAINAMFAWYRDSSICCACPTDVDNPVDLIQASGSSVLGHFKSCSLQVRSKKSRRVGWYFFSRQWRKLDTKAGLS